MWASRNNDKEVVLETEEILLYFIHNSTLPVVLADMHCSTLSQRLAVLESEEHWTRPMLIRPIGLKDNRAEWACPEQFASLGFREWTSANSVKLYRKIYLPLFLTSGPLCLGYESYNVLIIILVLFLNSAFAQQLWAINNLWRKRACVQCRPTSTDLLTYSEYSLMFM